MDTASRACELDAPSHGAVLSLSARAALALSFLTLLGPFLAAEIPPLTDYPNHLARFWLLAGGAADPALSGYYRVDWSLASTNIGVDAAVAALAPWVSAMASGRLAMILAAILPPIGLLVLSRRIFRRLTAWQVVFPIAAWSTTFLMGFLNFQIGLGLALLFAAADPLARGRSRLSGTLLRIPLGLILAVDHLFSLVFYTALLAALAMGPEAMPPSDWRSVGKRALKAALAASWCLIPLAAMLLYAHAMPGANADDGRGGLRFDALPAKIATLVSPLVTYNLGLELLLALGLAGLVVWLALRRRLDVHWGLLLAAAAFGCLSVVAPAWAADTAWVDRRFPIMALLCLLVSVQLKAAVSPRLAMAVSMAALALVAVRAGWVGWNWSSAQGDLASTRLALRGVPAGAAVLPLQHRASFAAKWSAPAGRYIWQVGDPTFRHYPALAVPLQRAFVPTLFAVPGKQPLQVLGSWDRRADHNGGDLASVSVLGRPGRPSDPPYLAGWSARFDYVLVLNADLPDESGPFRPPANLRLVADQGFAQLWRVRGPSTGEMRSSP